MNFITCELYVNKEAKNKQEGKINPRFCHCDFERFANTVRTQSTQDHSNF